MKWARAWLGAWSRTPRRTMRRWNLDRGFVEVPAMVAMAWLLAGRLLVVDAPRSTGRELLGVLAGGLASLAVAAGSTYLIVLYIRRPVEDEPPPRPVFADDAARAESERAAWRSRPSI